MLSRGSPPGCSEQRREAEASCHWPPAPRQPLQPWLLGARGASTAGACSPPQRAMLPLPFVPLKHLSPNGRTILLHHFLVFMLSDRPLPHPQGFLTDLQLLQCQAVLVAHFFHHSFTSSFMTSFALFSDYFKGKTKVYAHPFPPPQSFPLHIFDAFSQSRIQRPKTCARPLPASVHLILPRKLSDATLSI